ncbi:condensin-2 complex subunit D3 [Anabrus simplex]|uniref:condensin-2 complex subunit D3 n=1 Tax=Anabrus simplex TaxID=316456 RepID=UPI0035A391BE
MNVAECLKLLQLNLIDEEWTNKVWDSEFLDIDGIPAEYEELLESMEVVEILSAVKANIKNSRCDKIDDGPDAYSWPVLVQEYGVQYKELLALLVYFMKTGHANPANEQALQICVKAACLYLLLLTIHGSNAYFIFQMSIYEVALETLLMGNLLTEASGKKSKSADDSQNEDDEPGNGSKCRKLTERSKYCLLQGLHELLHDLSFMASNYPLVEDDALRKVVFNLIALTRIDTSSSNINLKSLRKDCTMSSLTVNAYVLLRQLCDPMHGDVTETVNIILMFLLPSVVMGGKHLKELPFPALSKICNHSVSFVAYLILTVKEESYKGVFIFVQHLCMSVIDKAEYRQKTAESVVCILRLLPAAVFDKTIKWFLKFSHSKKSSHRLFAVEIISKLLYEDERSTLPESGESERATCMPFEENVGEGEEGMMDCDGNDHPTVSQEVAIVSISHKYLLGVLFSRCHDKSSSVRTKALCNLADCMRSNNKVIHNLMEEIFVIPYIDNDNIANSDIVERGFMDSALFLKSLNNPQSQDMDPLPGGKAVVSELLLLSQDDKVYVRKAALQMLESIMKLNRKWMNKELLEVLCDHCRDPSLLIKKQSIQALTDLLFLHPEDDLLPEMYVNSVLPQLSNAEMKVQEKVLENSGTLGKSLQRWSVNCGGHSSAGRPMSVSVEEVHALAMLLDSDRSQMIHGLAQETGLAHTTVPHILKERLGMRKIASWWVPHDLTEMHKWLHYDPAKTYLERYEREGETFLHRIITQAETWAKSYEPKLKRQSNECRTVNAQYYCSFLEHHLRPALRKKWQHFLQNPTIILHDNARAHTAQAVAELFGQWDWEVLYRPPYSPDLSPCDFDLIPKMKEPLCGIRFRTVAEIPQAVDRSIRTINRTGSAKGILLLPHRWQRVMQKVIFQNLMAYERTTTPLSKLPWKVLLAVIKNKKRTSFLNACFHWDRSGDLPKNLVRLLKTHISTENNVPAWMFLTCIAEYQDIKDPVFALEYYRDHYTDPSEEVKYGVIQALQVLGMSCKHLSSDDQEQLLLELLDALRSMRLHFSLVGLAVNVATLITQKNAPSVKEGHEAVAVWAEELLKLCEAYINQHSPVEKMVVSVNMEQYTKALVLLGDVVQVCPGHIKLRTVENILYIFMTEKQCHPQLWKVEGLAALAVLTLGKICLQHDLLAKRIVPVIGNLLTRVEGLAIKVNTMNVLADMCVRYTAMVEPLVPKMCSCLTDPHVDVRYNSLLILIRLLQQDFLKLRGTLFFYLLNMLRDPARMVRELINYYICECLVKRQNSVMFHNIVESIFYFNKYEGHEIYRHITEKDSNQLFDLSGPGNKKDRQQLYRFMCEHMDDGYRIKTIQKICVDIFGGVVANMITLNEQGESVVKDAFFILSCEELKLAAFKKTSNEDDSQANADQMNVVMTTAKKTLLTEVLKKQLFEVCLPILLQLRVKLGSVDSQLLPILRHYMRDLMKDYKDELMDIFSDNKFFAEEILAEMQKEEEEQQAEKRRRNAADNNETGEVVEEEGGPGLSLLVQIATDHLRNLQTNEELQPGTASGSVETPGTATTSSAGSDNTSAGGAVSKSTKETSAMEVDSGVEVTPSTRAGERKTSRTPPVGEKGVEATPRTSARERRTLRTPSDSGTGLEATPISHSRERRPSRTPPDSGSGVEAIPSTSGGERRTLRTPPIGERGVETTPSISTGERRVLRTLSASDSAVKTTPSVGIKERRKSRTPSVSESESSTSSARDRRTTAKPPASKNKSKKRKNASDD